VIKSPVTNILVIGRRV